MFSLTWTWRFRHALTGLRSSGGILRRRGCLGEDGRKSSRRMREGGVWGRVGNGKGGGNG